MMAAARILIADEQRLFAKDLQKRLEDLGYEIASLASTGWDAVRGAERSNPDLVLMAVELEGDMDGIEAAERVRSRFDIPVVYLTSYPAATILERAKEIKPYGYLRRPFSTKQLATTIEIALHNHKLEKQLRESEKRYRAVVEDQTELICRFLPGGALTFVNEALCRYFGKHRGQLIGEPFLQFVPHEAREETLRLFQSLTRAAPTCSFEHRASMPDGEVRFLQWTARAIFEDLGRLAEFQAVGRDVTDQRRAEELLLQDERIKAIGQLAYGVAHNFNNVLQVIMGSADMASFTLQSGNTDSMCSYLDQIRESSRAGGEMVRRLQHFARRRPEKVPPGGRVFDFSHAVDQAIELTRPWWATNPHREGITISLTRTLQSGCMVKGRESELSEAVVNLIKNASEALVEGGHIDVQCFKERDKVILKVHDNGIGIEEESLGRIFEPFWTTKGFQAAGMGLASSYGIVNRHGGRIAVQSREGEGTTFTVELPLAQDVRELTTRAPSDEDRTRNLNILVIDDMEPVVTTLKDTLLQYDHTVFTALSGSEGLEIFRTTPIDLVICDLGMPGMSGWEVGKAIRAICRDRGIPKTPFVFATGWGDHLDEPERMRESGVDALLPKPVSLGELLEVIARVVSPS